MQRMKFVHDAVATHSIGRATVVVERSTRLSDVLTHNRSRSIFWNMDVPSRGQCSPTVVLAGDPQRHVLRALMSDGLTCLSVRATTMTATGDVSQTRDR